MDIGIETEKRGEIENDLSRVLADIYTLHLKTHNFHRNVSGPMFQTEHLMFETHYAQLALAVDLVAERIRALTENSQSFRPSKKTKVRPRPTI